MSKLIMFTRHDGGVTYRTPAPNGIREGESEDDFLARLVQDAIDSGKAADTPVVVDASEKPTDRALRNAWVRSGNRVVEDLAKARDLAAENGMANASAASLEAVRAHMKSRA